MTVKKSSPYVQITFLNIKATLMIHTIKRQESWQLKWGVNEPINPAIFLDRNLTVNNNLVVTATFQPQMNLHILSFSAHPPI
jgi:hypothetical protein